MNGLNLSILTAAFTAGLFSFFSPCVFPLLPVYIGYFSADNSSNNSSYKQIGTKLLKTLLFVAGISVVFFLLGFGAGALGSFLSGATFTVFCGIFILIFGLHYSGIINIPFLEQQKSLNWEINGNGYFSIFLLGLVFSFGWTPCIGPILASVLTLTAEQGSAVTGGWLLLIYSFGFSVPFLMISAGSSLLLNKVHKLNRYLPVIKLIGGLLIAVMGLWIIFSQIQSLENSQSNSNIVSTTQKESFQGEDFTLNTVSGETVSLSDYSGKPVCIKFWGTWCPSCMAGLENFQELANEINSGNEATILSIAAPDFKGEMEAEDFIHWAKAQNWTFPILLDEGANVNRKFNLKAYPSYLFFDKNGNLTETKVGEIQKEEIENILEELKN